ncbi:uncharacterized protein LOC143806022 [Ranitomeya variabilis]|uniref:uncharacterized protein LOC143806022 n=1 Tax=Ranitomeya variabilis TaxID=490064 RepID=UPI004057C10E
MKTMKTIISLVFILLMSSQMVSSLRCYICQDSDCSELCTTTCSEGKICRSVSYSVVGVESVAKGCYNKDKCDERPSYVPDGVSFESSCCDSNLCNSAITNKMSFIAASVLVLVSLYASRF